MKLGFATRAGAAVVAAGLCLGAAELRPGPWPGSRAGSAPTRAEAVTGLRRTLDPNLFQGEVKEAYEAAERDPALLLQLHCYCGCDRKDNHKDLLDCFRDEHGSRCEICVGEARDGEKMAAQGLPIGRIRDVLRARYAREE